MRGVPLTDISPESIGGGGPTSLPHDSGQSEVCTQTHKNQSHLIWRQVCYLLYLTSKLLSDVNTSTSTSNKVYVEALTQSRVVGEVGPPPIDSGLMSWIEGNPAHFFPSKGRNETEIDGTFQNIYFKWRIWALTEYKYRGKVLMLAIYSRYLFLVQFFLAHSIVHSSIHIHPFIHPFIHSSMIW